MTTTTPTARWQDLCLDAVDVDVMSRFWAAVTGLEVAGPVEHRHLAGPSPAHTVWVNRVDRPRTVKNRLHLDVDTGSVEELVALGATVREPAAETGFGWTGMADPEGGEFCAFVRRPEDVPAYRLHGVAVDCVDAAAQARWWGEVFGTQPRTWEGENFLTLERVAVDDRMTLDFAPVPEPRRGPNRVHWDVVGRVDDFLARGATHLWDTERWTVLADPEGNEFCVFEPVVHPG